MLISFLPDFLAFSLSYDNGKNILGELRISVLILMLLGANGMLLKNVSFLR